jgi:hypothetical protein
VNAIYFVDDNFIGNRRAARELVEALIVWQKRNALSFVFACEATLNIAKHTELLALMREAYFTTDLLRHRNARTGRAAGNQKGPQRERASVRIDRTLNSFGFESCLGHHSRPRHRYGGNAGRHSRIYPALEHSDADDQSHRGIAAHGAVRKAGARKPHRRGAWPRIECGVPAAL